MADLTGKRGVWQVGRRKRAKRSSVRRAALVAMLAVAAGLTVGASAASAAVLNVTLAGSGTGTVVSNPAGIDCSNVPGSSQTACSHDYGGLFGTGALTATPGEGSAFLSWSGTGGGTCSGATNPCTTGLLFSGTLSAVATFVEKPDPPAVTTGAASDVEFPSAKVAGSVNPNSDDFAISDCYFEYGLTTDYGEKAPCRPGSIGTGASPVAVSASIGVLDPDRTYHYRLVAANAGGAAHGEDQTLTSAPAPADHCPNAAIRAQQGPRAQRLPNCYAYELVAPPFSLGQAVVGGTIAPDGNAISLGSAGALEDAGNAPGLGGRFYAHRTEAGWRTVPLIPPATAFPTWETDVLVDTSTDARVNLFRLNRKDDENTRRFTVVRSDIHGNVEIAGPTIDDEIGAGTGTRPIASSADLRTIVIQSTRRGFTTDGAPDTRTATRNGLYVSRPSPDEPGGFDVRQVALRDGATMNAATCGVGLGSTRSARGAVSDDGRRIFFSFDGLASCMTAVNQRVWVRDGEAEVEDLATSICTVDCGVAAPAFFEVASYDGQRVYFTTEQKLVDGDQDTSSRADLYVYDYADADSDHLRPVTASGAPGQGAGVLGVVRASDDGSYVYFVANGRPLAGENARGESPQIGDNNLYVYHRPRSPLSAPETISFVGRLNAGDVNRATQWSLLNAQNRPVVISADGRFLLFTAFSDLIGEKLPGDSHRDLYRYDVATDELIRIWSADPQHNGAERSDGIRPTFGPNEVSFEGARQRSKRSGWAISDDGKTVAFSTAERLSPGDVNTQPDAYMWQEETGTITMLSDGRSPRPIGATGVSPGGDVFFSSDAQLVPEHRSGAQTIFVARRGGGFAPSPTPPAPCGGDACQGSPGTSPGSPSIGSVSPAGGGNVSPPGRVSPSVGVSRLRAVSGSVARLRVRVSGAGRIAVDGPSIRRSSRSASKAGTFTVRIALSARAKRQLRRKRALTVGARVSYRAKGGRTAARSISVTFKQPKVKRATAGKGGR